MTQDIAAIIFDLGGVLVGFRGIAALAGWMTPAPTPEELWTLWLSSPAVREFETGKLEPGEFAERVTTKLSLSVSVDVFLDDFAGWPLGPFAGAADLVSRIPSSIKRATMSNTNAVHWDGFSKQMGLADLFDHHFASHLTGKIKPDVEAFDNAVRVLDCDPEAVVFFDDQPINIAAASRAGVRALCVRGVTEAERALIDLGVLPS